MLKSSPVLDARSNPEHGTKPHPNAAPACGASQGSIRVCYYLFFPAEGSGIGKYSHEVLRHLAQIPDVEPTLACSPACHWQQYQSYSAWPGLFEISHDVRWQRRTRFLIGQFVNPCRFLRHAAQSGADIVHFGNINQLSYPFWAGALRRCRARKVATVHDVFRYRALVHPKYDNAQLIRFYRAMDALFVHAEEQASQLVTAGVAPERITIVPHGPYDSGTTHQSASELRTKFGLPHDRPIALAFGNVREDKNLDLLMRAIAAQSSPVHLLVAGRFGTRERTTHAYHAQLAQDLGIESRITYVDRFIESHEVPELFRLCDWVALPYSRTFTSQSGVLAVAMQYNRPVLVSRVGSAVDILRTCRIGVGVEPDDFSSLRDGVATIGQMVEDSSEFEFGQYRQRYSWEENARLTVTTYRRLLADCCAGHAGTRN